MEQTTVMTEEAPQPVTIRCRRCHRVLRSEKAREAGIGPVCARKELATNSAIMDIAQNIINDLKDDGEINESVVA